MQVPNGTGPGVRRSMRPLLASRTRCNVPWKPPKFGNKVKIGNKVQFGNKFANWCNVWSIEGNIVYGHVPECHVTFGKGRLHNVWWDPHIDHKTSWGTISNVLKGEVKNFTAIQRPVRPSCFICPINTNYSEDVEILLSVQFRWILFSSFKGEVQNVSANQKSGRPSCFPDWPKNNKLDRRP